jgi:hypothetical protein
MSRDCEQCGRSLAGRRGERFCSRECAHDARWPKREPTPDQVAAEMQAALAALHEAVTP